MTVKLYNLSKNKTGRSNCITNNKSTNRSSLQT